MPDNPTPLSTTCISCPLTGCKSISFLAQYKSIRNRHPEDGPEHQDSEGIVLVERFYDEGRTLPLQELLKPKFTNRNAVMVIVHCWTKTHRRRSH
ncbi:Uncharacterized protein OBRU01_11345 [Operophtera brumata]|uniref:Uncharacterized protein n=1 Tax=Operophtera brumata TaxID=104452 RepID=A0A0L7LC40_OPEBR|nr:Uncharacterized protein OBRU01_11345 [Operophtera brumata]